MSGNNSSDVMASCIECGKSFRKRGQNNKYCEPLCREERYRREGRSKKWTRQYAENNNEKRLVISARSRAKKKGLLFDIDHRDIFIPEVCPVLGLKLEMSKGYGGEANSPSLDRINNELGYVKGNVHVISHLANSMKSFASKEQLLKFANWILNNKEKL